MTLSSLDRRLVRLFTACVLGRWDEVRTLRRSAIAPEPDRSWREAVLQVHVFAGVPRQVEAYFVLEQCGGLGTPASAELTSAADAEARGRALFESIYRSGADDVRAMLTRHHPLFERWVITHAYGEVLGREGLSSDRRELLAVGALAALGQDRQLASHARGAVRCGANMAEVEAALDAIADLVEPERLVNARLVVRRFAGDAG